MRVFLIGYMLSGKSTVGKKLAKRLNYDFVDTDKWIENKYRLSVGGIFAKYGEEVFRSFEEEALQELIAKDNIVISTGGGLPCFGDNMERIKANGFSIYLNINPRSIIGRHKTSHHKRPLLEGKDDMELLQFVTTNLAERERFYRQADLIVRAESADINNIVSEVMSHTSLRKAE